MMRLLKRTPDGDLQLVSVNDDHPPPYAILSQTWSEGQEVMYDELVPGTGKDDAPSEVHTKPRPSACLS
jgi:hypothetical protein